MITKGISAKFTGISYFAGSFFKNPYSITVGIILSMILLFGFMSITPFGFKCIGNKITKDFELADATRDSLIKIKGEADSNAKAIKNQYDYLGALKKQYLEIGYSFEVYYYSFITILVISTVITTILTAVIAKKGWDSQSSNLQATFFGFFFCASAAGVFISVFNYSQNSTDNINKYFYMTNLQTNIYDVLGADPLSSSFNKDTSILNVFNANNKNLKENMNLFINVKAESIPVTDINKVLGTQKPGSSSSTIPH
jgi:hypothetical protein